jgi:hypothetical protein
MMTILLLVSLLSYFPNQQAKSNPPAEQGAGHTSPECSQPEAERDSLMREAEEGQYMIRWVMFVRNEHTSDNLLRRRLINLTEGDVFTRENLVKSLERMSKLKKSIHPANLSDVTIILDRAKKVIDIDICLKEKRR